MKNAKYKEREMIKTFESYEWQIKERLSSLDGVIRRMQKDMRTFGVTQAMQADFLPEQLQRLWQEVANEQNAREKEELRRQVG